MAGVNAAEARRIYREGYEAARAGRASLSNPYAPEHVPVWSMPRGRTARAAWLAERRPAMLRAKVWRAGYRAAVEAAERSRRGRA